METLLTGPMLQLAQKRVEAIKEGKSVAKYYESLLDGSGTKEEIKPKIDAEVTAPKESGLNFHTLAYLWLFDVGLTEETSSAGKYRAPLTVPKFLNRCKWISNSLLMSWNQVYVLIPLPCRYS